MSNAVLEALEAQRAEQISTIDAILGQVEGRDLVDAERSLLDAARQRIGQIDDQIKPLRDFEALRAAHAASAGQLPASLPATPRRADAGVADVRAMYPTPGHFMVDLLRAQGIMQRGVRDEAAAGRVAQARAVTNQTTTDTPGVLPTPIVGPVVNVIDASRPFLTSIGTKPLGGIPGATFSRPAITQHVTVGEQTAEKTELPSQKMSIQPVTFAKKTYGGTVDISRQDIDWTSPSAWDILITDLADVYAKQTEQAIARDFAATAAGTAVSVGTAGAAPTLQEWAVALYTAAMRSYNAGQRMPDRVWCSLDVWAALGSLVDVNRLVMPPGGNNDTAAGSASLADFRGDVIGLPRIVVPTFTDGTLVVGPSTLFEAYEEVIGLLSVVEPSILGVEVAYGGYVAWGHLEAGAYVPITVVGTLPTTAGGGPGRTGEPQHAPGARKANGS